MKQEVTIAIIHRGQTDLFQQTLEGQFFPVEPLGYLRYVEQTEGGQTMTTIRLLPDELRIQRRGAVESRIVLKPGERTPVSYRLGGSELLLTAYTNRLDFNWLGQAGTIDCFYDLLTDGDHADTIHLQIVISERKPAS